MTILTMSCLSGCGVPSAAPARPASTATALPAPTVAPRSTGVPAGVFSAARTIEDDYNRGSLRSLDASLLSMGGTAPLLGELRSWRNERVSHIRVTVLSSRQLSAHRYVETLRFVSDPRAVPAYQILVFDLRGSRARIIGSTTGIRGESYTTASWSITRSRHFVVYHSPYQLAGSDRQALRSLEHQRSVFERKFGVRVASHIAFFLYPDVATMDRLTHGRCGRTKDNIGCAYPSSVPPTIHSAIWPTYHEPIHIYERSMEPRGYEAPLFIAEGTAVALEDREVDPTLSDYCSDLQYAPLDDCALYALGHTAPLQLLADKGFNRANPGFAYALGGSFVKYLILRFGYRPFDRFYYSLAARPGDSLHDYTVASQVVYHRPIRQLVAAWVSALRRGGEGR